MKYLFKIQNKKEGYTVRVFRQRQEIIAELEDCFDTKVFKGSARNSEPEFDLSKGVRIAVARAKKEYYLNEIEKYKRYINSQIRELNEKLDTVTYLDKKYLLNREVRENHEYQGKVAFWKIQEKKDTDVVDLSK